MGGAIAARLEAEGFAVLAAGRRDGDITRPDEARALVERAAQELGGLDLLVNAASDGFEPRPVEEVTEADWDAALDATAKGSFFVTQAAAPHLRASSLGLVVMIEDVGAYQPWPSFAPHCAAKAAQAMLTRVLARALAPDDPRLRDRAGTGRRRAGAGGAPRRRDAARPHRLSGGRRGGGASTSSAPGS